MAREKKTMAVTLIPIVRNVFSRFKEGKRQDFKLDLIKLKKEKLVKVKL